MKSIFVLIALFLLAVILFHAIIFSRKIIIGKNLAKQHQTAFSFSNSSAAKRILILGDSTAWGTGTKSQAGSTAGYFHQDFPDAEIINISRNGAQLDDLINMIDQAEGKFDLVLVQGGANNIIYFTPLQQAAEQLDALLKKAKTYSPNVIMLTSGNIGAAPIWPPLVNYYYTARAKKYLTEFEKTAQQNQVGFVDLYLDKKDDVLLKDIKGNYAADELHLTEQGYHYWYTEILKTITENNIKI